MFQGLHLPRNLARPILSDKSRELATRRETQLAVNEALLFSQTDRASQNILYPRGIYSADELQTYSSMLPGWDYGPSNSSTGNLYGLNVPRTNQTYEDQMQMGKQVPGDVLGFFDTDWSNSLANLGDRNHENDEYERGDMTLFHTLERDPRRRAYIGQFEKSSLLRPVTNTHWKAPALSGLTDPLTTDRMSTTQFKQAWQEYDAKLSAISEREIALTIKLNERGLSQADQLKISEDLKQVAAQRQALNQGESGAMGRVSVSAYSYAPSSVGGVRAPAAPDPAGQLAPQAAVPVAPQGVDPTLLTAIAGLQADFKALATAQTAFINRPQRIQAPVGAAAPPAAPSIVHVPQPIDPALVAALRGAVQALTDQRIVVDRDAELKSQLFHDRMRLVNNRDPQQAVDPVQLQQLLANLDTKLAAVDTKINEGNNRLRDQIQDVDAGIRQAAGRAAPLENQLVALETLIKERDDSNRGRRDLETEALRVQLEEVKTAIARQRIQDPADAADAQFQRILNQVNATAVDIRNDIRALSERPSAVTPARIASIDPADIAALKGIITEIKSENEKRTSRVGLMTVPAMIPDQKSPALQSQIDRLGELVGAVTDRTNIEGGIVAQLTGYVNQTLAVASRVGVGPTGTNISGAAIAEIGQGVKTLLQELVQNAPLTALGSRLEAMDKVVNDNLQIFGQNQQTFSNTLGQVLSSVQATEAQIREINASLKNLEAQINANRMNEVILDDLVGRMADQSAGTGESLKNLVIAVKDVAKTVTGNLQSAAAREREILTALGEVKSNASAAPVFLPFDAPAPASAAANEAMTRELTERLDRLTQEKAQTEQLASAKIAELNEAVRHNTDLSGQIQAGRTQAVQRDALLARANEELSKLQAKAVQLGQDLQQTQADLLIQKQRSTDLRVQNDRIAGDLTRTRATVQQLKGLQPALDIKLSKASAGLETSRLALQTERADLASASEATKEAKQALAADAVALDAKRSALDADQRLLADQRKAVPVWNTALNQRNIETQKQLVETQRALNDTSRKYGAENEKLQQAIVALERELVTTRNVDHRRVLTEAATAARLVAENAALAEAARVSPDRTGRAIRSKRPIRSEDLPPDPAAKLFASKPAPMADTKKRTNGPWMDGGKRRRVDTPLAQSAQPDQALDLPQGDTKDSFVGDVLVDVVDGVITAVTKFQEVATTAVTYFAVAPIRAIASRVRQGAAELNYRLFDFLEFVIDSKAYAQAVERGERGAESRVAVDLIVPDGKDDGKIDNLEKLVLGITNTTNVADAKTVIEEKLTYAQRLLGNNPLMAKNIEKNVDIEMRLNDLEVKRAGRAALQAPRPVREPIPVALSQAALQAPRPGREPIPVVLSQAALTQVGPFGPPLAQLDPFQPFPAFPSYDPDADVKEGPLEVAQVAQAVQTLAKLKDIAEVVEVVNEIKSAVDVKVLSKQINARNLSQQDMRAMLTKLGAERQALAAAGKLRIRGPLPGEYRKVKRKTIELSGLITETILNVVEEKVQKRVSQKMTLSDLNAQSDGRVTANLPVNFFISKESLAGLMQSGIMPQNPGSSSSSRNVQPERVRVRR